MPVRIRVGGRQWPDLQRLQRGVRTAGPSATAARSSASRRRSGRGCRELPIGLAKPGARLGNLLQRGRYQQQPAARSVAASAVPDRPCRDRAHHVGDIPTWRSASATSISGSPIRAVGSSVRMLLQQRDAEAFAFGRAGAVEGLLERQVAVDLGAVQRRGIRLPPARSASIGAWSGGKHGECRMEVHRPARMPRRVAGGRSAASRACRSGCARPMSPPGRSRSRCWRATRLRRSRPWREQAAAPAPPAPHRSRADSSISGACTSNGMRSAPATPSDRANRMQVSVSSRSALA